jgi:dipeptidyl aminopeptidase/acylaminoacyl peptidase
MYLLDWSIDSLYKPKLLSYYRASPGDTTIVRLIPVFYEVETGREIQLDQLYSTHTSPVQFRWAEQPDVVYQERMFRGYQQVELHRRHLAKGTEELLYREISSTNIDNFRSQLIEEWGKALITSERDGWKQLYLLDLRDGALRRLASGDYYVNEVVHIDKAKRVVLFTASGKEAGRNPYHQHFYRLDVEKDTLQLLTPEDSNHEVWVSPDGRYFVDHLSTLNQPTRTLLRSTTDGKVVLVVSEAEVSGLRALHPNPFPEPFTAIGRDVRTEIYGAIWKPSHFDPNKRYPVIDQSYTGPHTFMFPRSFTSALSRSNQALAELGFVVITVDGMGTANRSKAFHTVSYKNMGKNLEDHRLAILQLGRRYTWLDTTRVGIFGHSAGGYDAAHALLEYPDFYKVAVASSADHDFRMEKAWWPEMYMGWPVDSTYHEVSNITMAHKLKGKLLITHGGIDENVNPSATFKLAEALVRANKEFDMLIFPSQRHGYVGHVNTYFTKKKWNYFVEHLLGAKPLWEFKMQ